MQKQKISRRKRGKYPSQKGVSKNRTKKQKGVFRGRSRARQITRRRKGSEFTKGIISKANERKELIGEPKGVVQLILERGLDEEGLKYHCINAETGKKTKQKDHTATCCMVGKLYNCDDFKLDNAEQHSVLFRSAHARGHLFFLLPRFHCELAAIERCWNSSKRFCRENCRYTIKGLWETVPKSLKRIPMEKIRQFFNRTFMIGKMYLEEDANFSDVLEFERKRRMVHNQEYRKNNKRSASGRMTIAYEDVKNTVLEHAFKQFKRKRNYDPKSDKLIDEFQRIPEDE